MGPRSLGVAALLSVAFALLHLVDGGTVEFPEPDPFVDEVSALHGEKSQRVDALWRQYAEGQLSEAEAHAEVAAVLSRHWAELSTHYRRHGKTLLRISRR
jgi:hypothetical protein